MVLFNSKFEFNTYMTLILKITCFPCKNAIYQLKFHELTQATCCCCHFTMRNHNFNQIIQESGNISDSFIIVEQPHIDH